MLRKLRRLRVPVCFYTCCSLFAILLFVSFNEDVKNLIQQNNHNRGNPSGSSQQQQHQHNFPSSFSSSSAAHNKDILSRIGNNNNNINHAPRSSPLISSIPSGGGNSRISLSGKDANKGDHLGNREHLESQKKSAILEPYLEGRAVKNNGEGGGGDGGDDDAIQQYINDNFVGHRGAVEEDAADKSTTPPPQTVKNSNVIVSNLVKLAQQASNNPNAFNNINSLTGNTFGDNSQVNNELGSDPQQQTTTADTDLLYPGGDANSQVRKRERQWFMTGGDYFPTPPGGLASIFYPSASWLASKTPSTDNVDYANLWYDSSSGSDRVIDQLMFAIDDPINYANISWGFEGGPTATTTVRPSLAGSTQEPGDGDDDLENVKNEGVHVRDNRRHASGNRAVISAVNPNNVDFPIKHSNAIHNNYYNNYHQSGMNDAMLSSSLSSSSMRDPRLGKIKTILLYYGLGMSWGSHITNGRQTFLQQRCPINACRLTGNRAQLNKADLVVFKDVFMHPKIKRPPGQLWVMYMLECPLNTQNFLEKNAFNLTATYRHDSDIVTPYEKWVYFDDSVRSLPQAVNYAEGKTKKVAWFVSNCVAKNNRLEYARELAKYIEVDIYGACGSHTCSRANAKQCFEMLSKNYKFYLAFENSNCRDYISEKFFVNGLGNKVLPIVMGAHPDDYKRVAPDRSYIHVDDFSSPKELAQYLHELDTNDDLYNEYFKWKGTGEFINTHFFCRLCAMAHYSSRVARKPSYYEDFNKWWRGPHICTRQSWRSAPDIFAPENYESVISHSHH